MSAISEAADEATRAMRALLDAMYPHHKVTDRRIRTQLLRRDRRALRRWSR